MHIHYNHVLKRDLSDAICIIYRDKFLLDGSEKNQCVAAITSTKPGQYHDWRGPIIAYGENGLGLHQAEYRDFTVTDFRHVVDFFLTYGYEPAPVDQHTARLDVRGVRINCIGDEKMFHRPHFEPVMISSENPIFSYHDTLDIAQRIEFPIFTLRYPPDSKWADHEDNKLFEYQSPFVNQDAKFLHLCCDPKADFDARLETLGRPCWAWVSHKWVDNVGSVLVVRQDKKPLFPQHVEALCRYCRYEIQPLLGHSIGEYAPETPMARSTVLSMICRPTFVIHWHKLRAKKREEGDHDSAPYPYEVEA